MRQRDRGATHRRRGITLTELLVVIGIMVLLLGLLFPAAKRLREDARYQGCTSNLRNIGTALKLYRMDEGGYPARLVANAASGYALDDLEGRGLVALSDGGYLRNERNLVCADDVDAPNSALDLNRNGVPDFAESGAYPEFVNCPKYCSYMQADKDAVGADYEKVKYCSFHFVGSSDSDYSRQLEPAATPTAPALGPASYAANWWPRDDTLVTWCQHHASFQKRNGQPQYVALFLDGVVTRGPAKHFRQPDTVSRTDGTTPTATWRLRRSDMPDYQH